MKTPTPSGGTWKTLGVYIKRPNFAIPQRSRLHPPHEHHGDVPSHPTARYFSSVDRQASHLTRPPCASPSLSSRPTRATLTPPTPLQRSVDSGLPRTIPAGRHTCTTVSAPRLGERALRIGRADVPPFHYPPCDASQLDLVDDETGILLERNPDAYKEKLVSAPRLPAPQPS